jgi:chromosome segregation ATPase
VTDGGGDPPQLDLDEALARIGQLDEERRELTDQVTQLRRELQCAKEDIKVKEEFGASLETELNETLDMLHGKVAYIHSLPSVRLKAWLLGATGRTTR